MTNTNTHAVHFIEIISQPLDTNEDLIIEKCGYTYVLFSNSGYR